MFGIWWSAPLYAADFGLRYVDHTGIQIAITWDPVPNVTGYVVERGTDPGVSANRVTYALPSTINAFGDTGWPLDDARRFLEPSNAANSPTYHLDAGVGYYYRVTAATSAGTRVSNVVGPHRIADFQSFTEIPRGVSGDLWADVVLGRPRFGENTWWQTDAFHTQYGGGVLVDRNTSHPTHVFIVDGNHSRILGMEALGRCRTSNALCSIDADCDGDRCTLLPGQMAPSFVIGQPDFGSSGCNLDGTQQIVPNREAATPATLCLLRPDSISVGETLILIQAAVDAEHNLYVPDQFNHRVLKYRDPFQAANGTAAVQVWGQGDFSGNLCNRGNDAPALDTLCEPKAVDVDAAGNLWVVDAAGSNDRVLRFPRNQGTGAIATVPDVVLGGMSHPTSVHTSGGDVYVGDDAGLRKYASPLPPGTDTSQVFDFIRQDPNFVRLFQFAFDPTHPGRVWAEIGDRVALFDLNTQSAIKKIWAPQFRGLDVSQAGDLFSAEAWMYNLGLYRLSAGQTDAEYEAGDNAFLGFGEPALDSMMSIVGITTVGDQLLVSDRYFVYFWNDSRDVTAGSALSVPADGMWGPTTPDYLEGPGNFYIVESDASGRVWINDVSGVLKLFDAPLTAASVPIQVVTVGHYKDASGAVVPLPSGVTVHPYRFLPIGSGDRVWVGDDDSARLLRVVNVDGQEAPGEPPFVDVVLGQGDWWSTECNRGAGDRGYDRDTFCVEARFSLDASGNLFIQDNATGGQDGGTTRILRWDDGTIPDHPTQTIFGVLPDSVYGNGGPANFSFDGAVCDPHETACTVRAASFAGDQVMALGACNPFGGPRYPLVYLDKDRVYQPQLALGDWMSFPVASHVDRDGNFYVADFDWQRVLVFKQPFSALALSAGTPTPRPTPTSATPTRTATPLRTVTPTRTATPTASSTPTFTALRTPSPGEQSGALDLHGGGQVVEVPDASDFPSGTHAQLTIEMWLRADVPGENVVVAKSGAGAENQTFFVARVDDQFIVNFAEFTSVAVTSPDSAVLGQWLHLVLVYDGAGVGDDDKLAIYVNGVAQPFTVNNAPIPASLVDSAAPVEIGGCTARSSAFVGKIDEVRFYDAALRAEDVQAHYLAGLGTCGASDEPRLIAGYHLDEGGGGVAFDYSGHGHHGAVLNGAARSSGWIICPVSATPVPPTPTATATPPAALDCANPVPVDKAQLKVTRNGDPSGDERIDGRGTVTVATIDPAIDPPHRGFTLLLTDATGAVVLRRVVPAGVASDSRAPGWRDGSATAKRWQFRDAAGTLADGITKVAITRLAPDRFKVAIKGDGALQIPTAALPLRLVMVFGDDDALAAGQCGTRLFNASDRPKPRCASTRGGASVTCR